MSWYLTWWNCRPPQVPPQHVCGRLYLIPARLPKSQTAVRAYPCHDLPIEHHVNITNEVSPKLTSHHTSMHSKHDFSTATGPVRSCWQFSSSFARYLSPHGQLASGNSHNEIACHPAAVVPAMSLQWRNVNATVAWSRRLCRMPWRIST